MSFVPWSYKDILRITLIWWLLSETIFDELGFKQCTRRGVTFLGERYRKWGQNYYSEFGFRYWEETEKIAQRTIAKIHWRIIEGYWLCMNYISLLMPRGLNSNQCSKHFVWNWKTTQLIKTIFTKVYDWFYLDAVIQCICLSTIWIRWLRFGLRMLSEVIEDRWDVSPTKIPKSLAFPPLSLTGIRLLQKACWYQQLFLPELSTNLSNIFQREIDDFASNANAFRALNIRK